MSPTLTEPARAGIAPPPRPSVWRVGWATFLGYAITVLVAFPFVVVLGYAGLDLFGTNDPGGRGVFYRYDFWSWLAEACAGLLATSVTAAMVGWQLRERTGWEVPLSFTFATLLLTGYAPLLTLTPFYWAAAPVSLAAAALILRWRCRPAGAEPHKLLGAVPRRYRRQVAIGLVVAGPVVLAYPLAYGATHPLHVTDSGYHPRGAVGTLHGGPIYKHEPGRLRRYEVALANSGQATVHDLAVVRVEGSPALQLERAGVRARLWTPPDGRLRSPPPLRPLSELELEPGFPERNITLELRQGRLCPPGIGKLDAVWIRYTVLGARHEQRLPLRKPPGVRCP